LHQQDKISDEQLNGIKTYLTRQGLNWENLPNKYEKYSIDRLGTWEYRP